MTWLAICIFVWCRGLKHTSLRVQNSQFILPVPALNCVDIHNRTCEKLACNLKVKVKAVWKSRLSLFPASIFSRSAAVSFRPFLKTFSIFHVRSAEACAEISSYKFVLLCIKSARILGVNVVTRSALRIRPWKQIRRWAVSRTLPALLQARWNGKHSMLFQRCEKTHGPSVTSRRKLNSRSRSDFATKTAMRPAAKKRSRPAFAV